MRIAKSLVAIAVAIVLVVSCSKESAVTDPIAAVKLKFAGRIDPSNLANYSNQVKPAYITKDNTTSNPITDIGATLGRVLFYDKALSTTNTVSCGSCHKQANAFGDMPIQSTGVNGVTGRHAMRLVNTRFGTEAKFFWNERAATLELQTTQPIQDHTEMGFSGANGDPAMTVLIAKLQSLDYYQQLFADAYGDNKVTEARMQNALAQFIRSIQSFDSKYDAGRSAAPNDNAPFANFTPLENQGKNLFLTPPVFNANGVRTAGGAGCQGCHRAPEFDIDPNSGNNGITGMAGSSGDQDFTITRSPSLRNLVNNGGGLNSLLMHDASFASLVIVIEHYNSVYHVAGNTRLDPKLSPGGHPQQLNLTQNEKDALVAFLTTLNGTAAYTDAKWSDPFK